MSNSVNGGDWQSYGNKIAMKVTSVCIGKLASFINAGDSLYRLETGIWTKKNFNGKNFKCGTILEDTKTDYIFTHLDGKGIYKSMDNGATWSLNHDTSIVENLTGQLGPKGLNGANSQNMKRIWDIYYYDTLLLANSKNSIHISEDEGATWYFRWGDLGVDHGNGSNIQWVFYRKYMGNPYLFVCTDGTVWNGSSPNMSRSNNLGVNYQLSDVAYGPSFAMVIAPPREKYYDLKEYTDSLLFVRCANSGMYVSYDNGNIWAPFNSSVTTAGMSKVIQGNKYLYLIKSAELYRYDLETQIAWSATEPSISNLTNNTADLTVNVTAPGKAYYVVLPFGDPAPTKYQIIKGLKADNSPAAMKGHVVVVKNIDAITNIFGLTGGSNYDVYVAAKSEILKVTGVVKKISFSTLSVNVSDILATNQLTVYPNPVENNLTLKIVNGFEGTIDVTIADVSGKIVNTTQIEKNAESVEKSILLSELTSGLYIMTVKQNGVVVALKIEKR